MLIEALEGNIYFHTIEYLIFKLTTRNFFKNSSYNQAYNR